jgi:hypothetical protein
MGNQAGSDTVAGIPSGGLSGDELARAQPAAAAHVHHPYHGRPSSWVAVSLMLAGFTCGGLSLVFATWPTFWVGVGLVVIGGLLATMTDIFEDWY